MHQKKKSVLPLSLVELGPRVGDSTTWEKTYTLSKMIGTSDMEVPAGSELTVRIYGVAIEEGVSISIEGTAHGIGRCGRCLIDVENDYDFSRTEVYYDPFHYDKLVKEAGEDQTGAYDERYQLSNANEIDLEPLLIDAIVPRIPFIVLCEPNCQGLCQECGVRLADAESGHHHEKIDPRWASLGDLFGEGEGDR